MKFLVFALCVCAANAASYGFRPFQPVQRATAYAQITPQVVSSAAYATPKAVGSAAYVASKAVTPAPYVASKAVISAPYVAQQAVYETAKVVTAAPVVAAKTVYAAGKEAEAGILRLDSDVNAEGYSYSFETNNGISSQASGILKNVDNADVIVSQGSYQYVAPDGTPVQFSYIADENGYQPRSDLLPVGPPIPLAIQRALEFIRNHPYKSDI